jgi:DNA (cytosine-5)-methyltransferase 1
MGKQKFRFIDLFAGLGGFHTALANIGGDCVFAAEKNKYLNEIYKKNYASENLIVDRDITLTDVNLIPQHEVLCAGFPCQPYSKAGNRKGMKDPNNGSLFDYILKIIDAQPSKPKFILLENVPNIITLNNGVYWRKIISELTKRGYEVESKILSPDEFGIPQHRKRVFLVASRVGLSHFSWPVSKSKILDVSKYLEKSPEKRRELSLDKKKILVLWQEFLDITKNVKSLGFPIWSSEYRATYPIGDKHPLKLSAEELSNYKGAFGLPLVNKDGIIIRENFPRYVEDARKPIKAWKKNYILRNRELFQQFENELYNWSQEISNYALSYQKFEWNCQYEKRNIDDKIIQFRPSGVRAKKGNSIPALVAMNLSQIPYFPWLNRYMTINEGLALQGMTKVRLDSNIEGGNYRAIGNAVNAEVVQKVAVNLIKL